MSDPKDSGIEALVDYLKRNRGFDFTGYKRASLTRRVIKRMREAGVENFTDYMDYLEVHPDEFTALFNTILINVTSFSRDPDSWDFLAEQIVPAILAGKSEDEPIRIWSAGCASGEEAYSIAMVMAEALGISEFRRRVKIYATDVDEEALEEARRATYSSEDLEPLSEERRSRFFEGAEDRFVFLPELRRAVIFGRHDLVKDPPMSRLDLIVCRNVLMYLNAQTQASVLERLHFALNPSGFIFLGRAEMLLSHTDLFSPVELKHRVFSKVPTSTRREQLVALAQAGNHVAEDELVGELYLRAGAFDVLSEAQIVIDAQGLLVLANRRAKDFFGLTEADLGRPLQDLELSYRPVELRSLIEEAKDTKQTVCVSDVERPLGEVTQRLDVQVSPILRNGGAALGASICFIETTAHHELETALQGASAQLEQANQAYQSANEELETTNEELQSTNEELETTNEELQSSNEELETMNEELQSTNEELRTMNDVLHEQTRQADEANAFLESVLAGLEAACVVVGPDLVVRAWKDKAEDLWGVRADEAEGESFLSLDIGLPAAELEGDIVACMEGRLDVPARALDAINRRGQSIRCRVATRPMRDKAGNISGAILMMEPMEAGAS